MQKKVCTRMQITLIGLATLLTTTVLHPSTTEQALEKQFETPILFIIWNRPDIQQKAFNQIKKLKPKHLYIASDGPRNHVKTDKGRCALARKIVEQVDWPCEVKTLLRDKNLGIGSVAVANSVSWFFEHVDEGIVLEDDCVASQSFFTFCEKMLDYYRHDESVFQISGFCNTQRDALFKSITQAGHDYFFAQTNWVWGWATWKRAWKKLDLKMEGFSQFQKKRPQLCTDRHRSQRFLSLLNFSYPRSNHWSSNWYYSIIKNDGMTVVPTISLIQNVGFGKDAAHPNNPNISLGKVVAHERDYTTIKHPPHSLVKSYIPLP